MFKDCKLKINDIKVHSKAEMFEITNLTHINNIAYIEFQSKVEMFDITT